MEDVYTQKHLPHQVMMRMMELLMEVTNKYGAFKNIAVTLKSEFTCLENISLETLSDRVRYHYAKLYRFAECNPLLPLIGTKHSSKTPVLTVSKKYLIQHDQNQYRILQSIMFMNYTYT